MMNEDDGQAFIKQRKTDHPVEQLADLLRQDILDKRQQMTSALMPDGRKPFHVALNQAETRQRLLDAKPPDWQGWVREIQAIPDPEQQQRAMGKFFQAWTDTTLSKQGIGQAQADVSTGTGMGLPSAGSGEQVNNG